MMTANGKILKKRRLSLNQFITDDDLVAIANDTGEGKGSNNNILVICFQQNADSRGGEIKPKTRVTRG